ncbi:MAG: nucleotidyltransferase domain-containing protein [Chloroflexi bacterium]|nr:nucleotidyltransferase domain-containing protein [Chloroflexota bacterium]
MNLVSRGGSAVARHITTVYRTNPKVRAIIVSGSVARGYADQYSDLEIGVFWETFPSDGERAALITRAGGELWSLTSAGKGNGEVVNEHYGLRSVGIDGISHAGLVMVDTKHATLDIVERCLVDIVERYDTSLSKQILLAAIEDGIPLYGQSIIETWQTRAKAYPLSLAIKMIQENLWCGPWFIPQAYVDRDDQLVLYQHIVWMQQSILKILSGLNRRYYRSAEHKWMDATIAGFALKPIDLATRMKQVFHTAPHDGMKQMLALVYETIDLVEQHCPPGKPDRVV